MRWELKTSLIEAHVHRTRISFIKTGAYHWLMRHNHLNKLDAIFPRKHTNWTPRTAIKEAKRYSSRSEFNTKNCGAYQWLLMNNGHRDKLNQVFPNNRKNK